jgi:hypothetical protein
MSREAPDDPLLPTFIIGGAPRSGTTYLCEALARHPGIAMARPFIPEPKVFMLPAASPDAYLARYRAFFPSAAAAQARGEKTSYYLESAEACSLIRHCLPDVRLVFIFREPVARAYSNYLWSRKNGLETLSFEEALALNGRRPNPLGPEKAYVRPFDYLARGNYADLVSPYLDSFRRDQLGFFLFEDIAGRPADLLCRLHRFLGVEDTRSPAPGVVNPGDGGPELDPGLVARLAERFRSQVERFASLTGLDVGRWGY